MKIETIQLSESCQIELHYVKEAPSDPPESNAKVLRFCFDLNLAFNWEETEGIVLVDHYATLMSNRLSAVLGSYRQWLKQVAVVRGLTLHPLQFEIGERAIQSTLIASVLSEGLKEGLKRGSKETIRLGRPTFTPVAPKTPRTRRG